MKLKGTATTFFDNWIRAVILFIVMLVMFFIGNSVTTNQLLNNILFCLLLIGISIIVLSIFYQLSKRNHLYSFLTLSVLAVGFELMFVLFLYSAFTKIMAVPVSNKLVIPKDYDSPLDSNKIKP